jgi:hypothetical protein
MKKITISRIKSAGKNISNVSYLMIVSNIIPIIGFFHIKNLRFADLSDIGYYYFGYGITYLVIAVLIMFNIYSAGNNLSLCDIETNEIDNDDTIEFWHFKNDKKLKIVSKNNVIIGANAFLNNEQAPDGEYEFINGSGKIIIRNGKVEKKLNSI